MDKIIISIEGGIVTSVKNHSQPIEVRDYDIDGLEESQISYDENGRAYYKYNEEFQK